VESRSAKVYGGHRAMCILSLVYRGTEDRPGLVLGLDRGGQCAGKAYRIAVGQWDGVKRRLDERELVSGVYQTRWLRAHLDDGRIVDAYGYVARRDHRQYWSGTPAQAARMITTANGINGRSYDYLINTINDLKSLGIQDHSLNAIIRMVE
jgi:cation transport protein ChaC